jgi:flagellar basal-body rod protein FlgC
MDDVRPDQSDFKLIYEPGHPAADGEGYVKYPNVSSLIEMMDMRDAQRSYEANLTMVEGTRRMLERTLDLLRR